MFCPHCGVQIDQDAHFCSSCGKSIMENTAQNSATPGNPSIPGNETNSNGLVYKILGWFFFAVSLLFIPIIFGAGAFIMGYLLRKSDKRNESHGTILMVMGVAGALLGMLLGMAAAGY